MKTTKLFLLNKFAKQSRADNLSRLIRLFISGKISEKELESSLEKIYNRHGDSRASLGALGDLGGKTIGSDPLYKEIYRTITSTYPRSGDLEPHQIESYTNTISARAATTERLTEYNKRGVQMVQVVAYIDHATTNICKLMHGRVFELGAATETLSSQQPLVQSANFWQANDHFAQTPSADMTPWLPPYHYNCRTRIIPFIEPKNPLDDALKRAHNLEKLQNHHIQAIVDHAKRLEFASSDKLAQHTKKHKAEYNVTNNKQYLDAVKTLLQDKRKQMALAISARDGTLTLYVWDPKVRIIENKEMHDFAVFSLDDNILKTLHAKPMDKILENLNPKKHGKVMMLTDQYTSKGDKNMTTEYEVKKYEYIIDYLETDDSTDIQEIYNREGMEKEWDTIPEHLKKRILAVDAIVLEHHADDFDYQIFKDYIKMIRNRQNIEKERQN